MTAGSSILSPQHFFGQNLNVRPRSDEGRWAVETPGTTMDVSPGLYHATPDTV